MILKFCIIFLIVYIELQFFEFLFNKNKQLKYRLTDFTNILLCIVFSIFYTKNIYFESHIFLFIIFTLLSYIIGEKINKIIWEN